MKTVESCPPDVQSVHYGYSHPTKTKSFVLGEACYSETEGRTRFIHTKVNGRNNVYLRTEDENYFKQTHPPSSYKIDYLMALELGELSERLKETLGTDRVPHLEFRHFIEASALQNKQFGSILKLSWNFATANGFEKLPNWDLLQSDIQQATADGRTFELYMGTHGILALPNAAGKKTEIFLRDDDKRFPVPKYLWAVVREESKAVAFAVLNDVRDTENASEQADDICESKCDQITWLTNLKKNDALGNVQNGKVFCCGVEQFANAVAELPRALRQHFDLLV